MKTPNNAKEQTSAAPASHTPGPWTCGARHPGRIIGDNSFVACCTANPDDDDSPNEQERANAQLIVAAPDLLAALDPDTLEAIANEIAGDYQHTARADSLRVIARQQRAAIAKAKGLSQ